MQFIFNSFSLRNSFEHNRAYNTEKNIFFSLLMRSIALCCFRMERNLNLRENPSNFPFQGLSLKQKV